MKLILAFYDRSNAAINDGASIEKIVAMPVREKIGRFKYVKEDEIQKSFDDISAELDSDIDCAVKTSDED